VRAVKSGIFSECHSKRTKSLTASLRDTHGRHPNIFNYVFNLKGEKLLEVCTSDVVFLSFEHLLTSQNLL